MKFGNGVLIFFSTGIFIETIIGLFSVMKCEFTSGIGYHMFRNQELLCFSNTHTGLFVVAIVIFVFYYLFVLFFYPFISKAHSKYDSHFNFDINGQLFYCMVFVFIPQKYVNVRLFMSLLICAFLCVFWVQDACNNNERRVTTKAIEYSLITFIYFCSLIFYNFGINFVGFWVLIGAICFGVIINLLKCLMSIYDRRRYRLVSNSNSRTSRIGANK